ncbi:MAG: hypothetical protein HZC55_26530 [Verrucomicrobia bacterium]|nr:hypothetical protein [Verrucomicrobiota bacterium]
MKHPRGIVLTAALLLTLGAVATKLQAVTVWDLKNDWNLPNNPNGPWSYNAGNTPMPYRVNTAFGPGYSLSPSGFGHVPIWAQSPFTSGFVQAGDIIVHAWDQYNGAGGQANVTWTSPIDGFVDISGFTYLSNYGDRLGRWRLSIDGVEVTGGALVGPPVDTYSSSNPFNFSTGYGGASVLQNVHVSIGDVIQFQFEKLNISASYAGPSGIVGLTITERADTIPDNMHAAKALLLCLLLLVGFARTQRELTIRPSVMRN